MVARAAHEGIWQDRRTLQVLIGRHHKLNPAAASWDLPFLWGGVTAHNFRDVTIVGPQTVQAVPGAPLNFSLVRACSCVAWRVRD